MSEDDDIRDLASRFRALGARDPEAWARSQVSEGIDQLARYVFLREAWRRVVTEDDASWIDDRIAKGGSGPSNTCAGIGHGLRSLRERGATDAELIALVRGAQTQLLFDLCYLIDDPGIAESDAPDVAWRLFTTGAEGQPVAPMTGLHESVLDTDPTGREMRPGK